MNPKVMIADDETHIHLVLKSMLKSGSYRIQDAYNGKQVLEGVRSDPPDLILLDVNMPDQSGLKVLEELRRDPKTKDMRVLLMTGDPKARQLVAGSEGAAADCITKPFDPGGLKARLERMLGRSAPAGPAAREVPTRPSLDVAHIVDALNGVRGKLVELDRKYSAADQLALRHIQSLHARLWRIERERAVWAALAEPRSRRLLLLAVSVAALFMLLGALHLLQPPPAEAPSILPAPALPTARAVVTPAGPRLQSVRVQSFRVTFITSAPVAARASLDPKSGDLFVDLPGTDTFLSEDRFFGRGRMIRGVLTARASLENGPGVRSRIYLRGPVGYQLRSEGNRTIVDLYYGGRKFT